MAKRKAAENPAGSEADPQGPSVSIPPERVGDPYAYLDASNALTNAALSGEMDAIKAQRIKKLLAEDCEANTGMTFKEISGERANPIERFVHLFDLNLKDLGKLEVALGQVEDARLSAEKKSRYLAAIARMKEINRACVADSVKCMVYVMRDAEPDIPEDRLDSSGAGFLRMQWYHVEFHAILTDPAARHCVIMCHPGTGKSFTITGWVTHQIGNRPGLRVLLIQDTKDKPQKSIRLLKEILKSPRFRALFPEVRVLERTDGAEDSAYRFTVTRPNRHSKEPTFEAASIGSKINGNGYDLILGDDVCPKEVKDQPAERQRINDTWVSVIEERLRGTTGRIKVIGTPWHPDDVLGVIRKEVEGGRLKNWRLGIKQFAIDDGPDGLAVPSLWGEKWGVDYYEDKKRRLGSGYALNYRLMPVENRYRPVQRVCLYNSRTGDSASTDNDRLVMDAIMQSERWLSVDPAATRGASSCDNGVIDAVITPGGFGFVLDVDFVQGNATEMVDWLVRRIYFAPSPGYAYIQIEAQSAMTGQAHLWEQMVTESLKSGMIPDQSATGERTVTQMEPCRKIPQFVHSNVRWGNKQNMSKLDRLKEAVPFIENAFVRFPGCRVAIRGQETRFQVIPGSRMERFREILLHFDGTNEADAVDALTQWIMRNKDRLNDPRVREAARPVEKTSDRMTDLFRRSLARIDDDSTEPYDQDLEFLGQRGAA